ncbi:MAG TPA: hypothetical protein VH561_22565 [Micromonosporaceae bacterium]
MSRRREPVDPHPGPEALWHFLGRYRSTLVIVACGVLATTSLTDRIIAWTDGAPCAAPASAPG